MDKKLRLNEQFLKVVLDKKDSFEVKFKKINYLKTLGADVDAHVYGRSVLSWAKLHEVDDRVIGFLEANGASEWNISKEEALMVGKLCFDEDGKVKSLDEIKEVLICGGSLARQYVDEKQNLFRVLSLDSLNSLLSDLPEKYVVYGHVILSSMGLKELPNMSHLEVDGGFWCDHNYLKNLKGAPMRAETYFECHNNELESLEGAPRYFYGNFNCYANKLKTLEGGPDEVVGMFDCSRNELSSLNGAPLKVGTDFNCDNNQLKTLEGAPLIVGRDFKCCGNQLDGLEGKPTKIGSDFIIEPEVLEKIKNNKKNEKKSLGGILGKFFADKRGR